MEEKFDDLKLYRSIVGKLLYVCHTIPEISFSVTKVAQFMQSPCVEHWVVVKRILHYLHGTSDYGLVMSSSTCGYVDAINVIDFGVSLTNIPKVWCDNTSTVAMAANPIQHAKTKHVDIDHHFVKEKVLSNQLQVNYVPVVAQIANILTKTLLAPLFTKLRNKLNVISIQEANKLLIMEGKETKEHGEC
ncbi:hypothetical protein PVK06_030444 [Gossypium arboreum]|uniref:Retrovirus-related Pol polyprotein from transposon TNT 1-94 n=1 Tax=Gossypium arboreum TaxID=29729 RepID=A0ABR0NNA9_GOSAR|nr:hypothetical protein PVK06_030444 [Gossypium arboreum]